MNFEKQFEWVFFYKELAKNLISFKTNRHDLVERIVRIFMETGITMPTLDRPQLVDIDPFTIFGLFNKNSQKTSNRIKILKAIKEVFCISADVPDSFDSVPVLNNQNATYYEFTGYRSDNDIDDLWNLFENALKYADDSSVDNKISLSNSFDVVIQKRGNGNSKVTMGLYWISPETFLNLDSRNEWFIYESGKIPKKIVEQLPPVESKISANEYFKIVEKVSEYLRSGESEYKDYKELSFAAWRYSTEVNKQNKLNSETDLKGSGLGDENVSEVHFWMYAPGSGASFWDQYSEEGIMKIGWGEIGDLSSFSSRTDMQNKMKEIYGPDKSYKNDSLATWQFANELKPGDIVYAKKGMHKIVGRGIVSSPYYFDESDPGTFNNARKVEWINIGDWSIKDTIGMKTLTDITQYTNYVAKIESLFIDNEDDTELEVKQELPEYNKELFLKEVYLDSDQYDTLLGLLSRKKNVIIQGAPGVGKTFAAKRLAYSIIGEMNRDRVMMIQFHQSYSYEDFIEGYRPSSENNGFEIKKGSFYNFCKKAVDDKDHAYFFIIDEINRGNLSKIFGELFMLIENDKRGNSLQLLYSDEKFFVPDNVYIIGLMNTADRSLALLDYALRRRFSFFEMKPAFDQREFVSYADSLNSDKFMSLINCIKALNSRIKDDTSLGEGFCIGHSFFCDLKDADDSTLRNIIEYEIIPLIREYWFDEPDLVEQWSERLRESIK